MFVPRCPGRWLLPAAALIASWLLSFVCHADEPAPTFIGIDLARMTYYPELGITEIRVRREMGKVIKEHRGVIDFATVQDVASRITSIYRGAGFVFTRAYVPQQQSRNGWVQVRLLEGWLSAVDILDNRRYSRELLEEPFADLKGKVVYSPEMEEAMALLNDYPGLNVFGFYSVGDEPGSTRLNVRVQRERDWTASLHADNYGSELTGRVRLLAEAEAFNPSGSADHLRLGVLQTIDPKNATFGQLDYDIPIFDKRSKIALRVSTDSFAVSRGIASNQQIDFSGKAYAAQIEFTRFLKRSNSANVSWHIGVDRDISTIDLKNIDNVDLDQKTWDVYAGFQFDRLDRRSAYSYAVGADIAAGRYDSIDVPGQSAQYQFAHGFAEYNRGVAIAQSTHQWKVGLDWQYSSDLLPTVSQYALTGPTRLRGFLPGDFTADTAAIARATWLFPKWAFAPAWTGFDQKGDVKPDVTVSLFAEYGYGEQNIPGASANDWGAMSDIGTAWSFTYGPDLSATLTLATPLSHSVNYQDNRVTAAHAWLELLWRFH